MTVTTVFATAPGGTGCIRSLNASYATARTTYNSAGGNHSVGQTLGLYQCFESFVLFDTSGISDTDIVTGVVLSIDGVSDASTQDFNAKVAASSYDGGPAGSGDWISGDSLGALTELASWNSSAYVSGYNAFDSAGATFNSAINLTGNTALILFSDRHVAGNTPVDSEFVTFTDADAAGTTTDPKLDITHGPIAFRAFTAKSATPAEPTGTSLDDIVLAICTNETIGATLTPATGFTVVANSLDQDSGVRVQWAWARRGASALATNWSGGYNVALIGYTGCKNSGSPINVSATDATNTAENVFPTITTTVANCMIVGLAGTFNWGSRTPNQWANERYDSAEDIWMGDDGLLVAAGATGTIATAGAGDGSVRFTIALEPVAGAAAAVNPPRLLNINQAVNRASSW